MAEGELADCGTGGFNSSSGHGGIAMLMDTTSKHILGTTELTCLMPIKSGFVGEFETRTYATRLRIAMKVLNGLRVNSREVAPLRIFPDIVDVIRSIHSFQLSIIGNKQLLLAVTFDGPWESYMRFVWSGLGKLLDLLLINCVDYEAHASDKGFDRFSDWVRRHQIDTGLFYAASACSVDDIRYLTQLESAQLNEACPETFDKAAAILVAVDPVKQAEKVRNEAEVRFPGLVDAIGLKVISAFYSLRDSYPDRALDGRDLPDARYLHRAARETLKEFETEKIPAPLRLQFRSELDWFEKAVPQAPEAPIRHPAFHEMQGGILPGERRRENVGKPRVAHGCLLLARVVEPPLARTFLSGTLLNYVSRQGEERLHHVDTNVAFTFAGLRRLGVSATDLASFPKEFGEGMEARAGMLGDVRSNHPKNWSLPEWNWPGPATATKGPVRLSTIDIVVKMRASGPSGKKEHSWSEAHPLYEFATTLFADPNKTGVQVMSVQPMLHHVDAEGVNVIDHFGFVDGISQPRLEPDGDPKNDEWSNQVALGELFLGYQNDRTDPAFLKKDDPDALPGRELGSLLDNGTFLVVRKLEQHVGTLNEVLKTFLEKNEDLGWTPGDLLARMVGRELNGAPLTAQSPLPDGNKFTYKGDNGSGCPLHAHIRRGNPRGKERVPRIMRRGMSYGPRFEDDPREARGLMFLAYNASIAEQFEVIQRWMAGGNSTSGFSGHADPFLRVPQKGENGIFRFVHKDKDKDKDKDKVRRLHLGDDPFVSLKWGLYLFVPSISAIKTIAAKPKLDTETAKAQIALGQRIIASLQTDDDWSAILEDVTASHSGTTEAVYAAIRARGGVLKTPDRGMVLVASEPLVKEVLGNDAVFSVSEYKHRMAQSIGEVYLGLDFSEEYVRRSKVNKLVSDIGEQEAFRIAEQKTNALLDTMLPKGGGRPTPIALETLADQVLARLSAYWFGVPNDNEIRAGGRPAKAGDVHLPFHSLAPSRYIFSSPSPRNVVTAAGKRHGKELRNAVTKLAEKGIAEFRAPLAKELWDLTPDEGDAPRSDVFARTLVGFIEGFLPTVYGNFLKTMHLWISDETLWRVQQDLRSDGVPKAPYERAHAIIGPALRRAMQKRPVPDIVYRTATQRHKLNGETIEAGERVVVLIASATQEFAAQQQRDPDVTLVFGGNRKHEPHPTHACPAYDMGMGVLLGMIGALLERTTLTPTDSPLSIEALQYAPKRETKTVAPPEKVTA
jgi:Dyp-type peroxidase family